MKRLEKTQQFLPSRKVSQGQLRKVANRGGAGSSRLRIDLGRKSMGTSRPRPSLELAEAYFDPALKQEAPWPDRDALATLLPRLPERFPTHTEYGRAGIQQLLGE